MMNINTYITKTKTALLSYQGKCSTQRAQENQKCESFKTQAAEILKGLDTILFSIDKKFTGKLNTILSCMKNRTFPNIKKEEISFDRFVYYIDRVNDLNIPDHIIKKNPHFCETILTAIVEDYLKIKAYIASEERKTVQALEDTNSNNRNRLKEKVLEEWTKLTEVDLRKLAEEEKDSIVQKIYSSL